MKTDIQIAQEAEMKHIKEVAVQAGISEDELEFYGKYKAKLSDELWNRIKDNKDGKLVLVTAINPTPAGEGKTTTSVGLGQAFAKLGKKAMIALREPSLGPCFGIKGGAGLIGFNCDAQLLLDALDLHLHLYPELGVQVGEGLIQQQNVRILQNQAGQVDPGLLPAGEGGKKLPPHVLGNLQAIAHLIQLRLGIVAAPRLKSGGEGVVPPEQGGVCVGAHLLGEAGHLGLHGVKPVKGRLKHILHGVGGRVNRDL